MWDLNTGTGSHELHLPGAVPQGISGRAEGILNAIGSKPARILIVEDQKNLSQLMHDVLQASGARVWVAGTGFDAYELMARQPFDLMLLDVDLPDANGVEICRWIRSQKQFQESAVMFCTGSTEVQAVADELGVRLLRKPFLMGMLLEEATRAIAEKAALKT